MPKEDEICPVPTFISSHRTKQDYCKRLIFKSQILQFGNFLITYLKAQIRFFYVTYSYNQ